MPGPRLRPSGVSASILRRHHPAGLASNRLSAGIDIKLGIIGLQTYMTTMSQRKGVPTIRFDATLYTIDERTILRLPQKASEKLPSRGQVAVQGTINGYRFQRCWKRTAILATG